MSEIKSCPFCGGKAECFVVEGGYMVTCAECGASTIAVSNKQNASRMWNERTNISGCPVCGWHANFSMTDDIEDDGTKSKKLYIKCSNCGLRTAYIECSIAGVEAVKDLWNARCK